jgi:hypothetical protein
VVRPRLGLAGDREIRLGPVGPGEPAESGDLRISNAQATTIDDQHGKPVASILYGCCRMRIDPQFAYKVATEHVGCELVGPDAAAFELAGDHAGEDGRTLSLIGGDGEPGLAGGPDPERETFRVRFRGRPEPRRYTASVRVVTQAGNLGKPSPGGPGEPLPGLFFVEVPVEATVGPPARP